MHKGFRRSLYPIHDGDALLEIEIEIAASINTENPGLRLPDRMFTPSSSKIWTMIYGNRKRLKSVADTLVRFRPIQSLSRTQARAIQPEILIGGLFQSLESRSALFREHIEEFSREDWSELILSVHHRVVKKRQGPHHECIGLKLDKYDIRFGHGEYYDDELFKAICQYTDEAFYKELSSDEKDLADFVVNASLCEINDLTLMIDFLDKFPWLKAKNKGFYQAAVALHKREMELEASKTPEEFVLEGVAEIRRVTKIDPDFNIPTLVNIARSVNSILSHERLGILPNLSKRLYEDQIQLIEYVQNCMSNAMSLQAIKSLPVWDECKALIAKLGGDTLTVSSADSEGLSALETYCNKRRQTAEDICSFPDRFEEVLSEFNRLKGEVADEATKDVSDVDVLLQKTEELKKASVEAAATGEGAGQSLLETLKTLAELKSTMEALTSHTRLAIGQDQPLLIGQDSNATESDSDVIAQRMVELEERLAKSDSLASNLQNDLAKATDKNVTLEEKRATLEEEVKQLRKDNHELRQRLEFEPQKQITLGLSQDLNHEILMALVTQERKVTPEEILHFYQALAPDRLVVLPSAYDSAARAEDFSQPYRLSLAIWRLIYDYLDDISSGIPDAEARKIFGTSGYSAKESEGVTQNARLRAMREFKYQGKEVLFLQHLSLGRNYGTSKSIRVYFKIIEGKVVIAHCGMHMECMQTN